MILFINVRIWGYEYYDNVYVWQYQPVNPHYLNQPNYTWPLESSSGFSHLQPWVFHISLQIRTKHTTEGLEKKKKNKQSGLG